MITPGFLCRVLVLAGLLTPDLAVAADGPLSGFALAQKLAAPAGVTWAERDLRPGLERLSHQHHVALFLDRRIDPSQTLDLDLPQATLAEVLEGIAGKIEGRFALVGPVGYIGPEATAAKVRTLAALRFDEAQKLPPAAKRRLLTARPLRWKELATPREVVAAACRSSGVTLTNIDQLPHDLWPGADWPALHLPDSLTLLAAPFDLTFRLSADGSQATLVPMPATVTLERRYPAPRDPEALAQWQAKAPEAEIRVEGSQFVVVASLEAHELLSGKAPAKTTTRPAVDFATQRYTLAVQEKEIGAVLEKLAKSLNLELKTDRAAWDQAGISWDKRVSFSVKEATVDQLFSAALHPVGLAFRRKGQTLEVFPGK